MALSESDLRCQFCGGWLMSVAIGRRAPRKVHRCLTCGREPSLGVAPASFELDAVEQLPPPRPKKPRQPMRWKSKRCTCGKMFAPTGGRDAHCIDCKVERFRHGKAATA